MVYTVRGSIFDHDSQSYLAFVNFRGDSLVIVSISQRKKIVTTSVKGLLNPQKENVFLIQDDTLHIYNSTDAIYKQISIAQDFTLSLIASRNLKSFLPKNAALNGNSIFDKKMAYRYPFLLLPYMTIGKMNYAGKNVVLQINLQSDEHKQIVNYPETYRECSYIWIEPLILTNNKYIITVFPNSDEIRMNNLVTGTEDKLSSNDIFTNTISCYDARRSENLAYDEKYQKTTERNVNILEKNDFFYIIKKLKKNEIENDTQTAILVFDKNLKQVKTEIIGENVATRLSFIYHNKIAIYHYGSQSFYLYNI